MNNFIDRLFEIWFRAYAYDYEVLSQPWIYWTVFPAIIYYAFFVVKWGILTAPIWLPMIIVINTLGAQFSEYARNRTGKK